MSSIENVCHEEVSRKGQAQPCEKPAVALRIDPNEGTPYPVCIKHTRADMVPLAARLPATTDAEAALERVDWWNHAGVWNSNCGGKPTRLHWTRPGQLEAKCGECGFALVAMDADGQAIRAGLAHKAGEDE